MKFHGKVGYGTTVETSPGIFEDVITEKELFGDVIRNFNRQVAGEEVNPTSSVSNAVSFVADSSVMANFSKIRYVEWAGVLWAVISVEIQRPRLILSLGEVYSGPTPAPVSP
jgi:hypothetical protein